MVSPETRRRWARTASPYTSAVPGLNPLPLYRRAVIMAAVSRLSPNLNDADIDYPESDGKPVADPPPPIGLKIIC